MKFEIELPEKVFLRNHEGKAIYWNPADTPAVIAKVCEIGAKTVLTNVWNGGGATATDAERLAALQKKLDSWARGEFNVVERGESQFTAFREVYIADCIAAGMTTRQAESIIRDTVAERLGKDAKATFSNYLDAMALAAVEAKEFDAVGDAREALEGYYAAESERREKERAKSKAKVVAPKLDLSAFKKTPAK